MLGKLGKLVVLAGAVEAARRYAKTNPDAVGKTQSHGCIRLTNWDAGLLGGNIKKGTPVVFVEEPQGGERDDRTHRSKKVR